MDPVAHLLESHWEIAERVSRLDDERYVFDETYDGSVILFDRTNPNAWILSDVTGPLDARSRDDS